jgi:hypothetical protein
MLRKILCAVTILAISMGVAMAKELKGKITKIDGTKITFVEGKDKDGKDLEAIKDVKISQMKEKEKVAVEGGLAGIKIGEKGKTATLITNDDKKVVEIIFSGKKAK